MEVINLTPHAVVLTAAGKEVTIPPSGTVARVTTEEKESGSVAIDGIVVPLLQTKHGAVENLPAPEDGTIYIVSSMIVAAAPERTDCFAPARLIRNEAGQIIGAGALSR